MSHVPAPLAMDLPNHTDHRATLDFIHLSFSNAYCQTCFSLQQGLVIKSSGTFDSAVAFAC